MTRISLPQHPAESARRQIHEHFSSSSSHKSLDELCRKIVKINPSLEDTRFKFQKGGEELILRFESDHLIFYKKTCEGIPHQWWEPGCLGIPVTEDRSADEIKGRAKHEYHWISESGLSHRQKEILAIGATAIGSAAAAALAIKALFP